MGIYSGTNNMFNNHTIYPDTIESIMEDNNLEPLGNDDDLVEAGFGAILDIHENYNSIMQRIGVTELSALEDTGEEYVYTEGALSSIYNTIKNFLKKVWEKIKALFKRFIMIIDSYTKNDKDFLNKYRKELGRVTNTTNFEFKGYNFSRVNTPPGSDTWEACRTSGAQYIDNDRSKGFNYDDSDYSKNNTDEAKANTALDNQSEEFEAARGEILNTITKQTHGKLTLDEFKKELREWYRNGESQKVTLDGKDIQVHSIITELSTSETTKKNAHKAFTDNKKVLETEEKDLDRLQRTWVNDQKDKKFADTSEGRKDKFKNENTGRALSYYLKECSMKKDCMIAIDSVYLEALKDRSRQNKAIAVKLMNYKPKGEAYNESYIGSYSGENFLSGIELK